MSLEGVFMESMQTPHRVLMESSQSLHGVYMGSSQSLRGVLIKSSWSLRGVHEDSMRTLWRRVGECKIQLSLFQSIHDTTSILTFAQSLIDNDLTALWGFSMLEHSSHTTSSILSLLPFQASLPSPEYSTHLPIIVATSCSCSFSCLAFGRILWVWICLWESSFVSLDHSVPS